MPFNIQNVGQIGKCPKPFDGFKKWKRMHCFQRGTYHKKKRLRVCGLSNCSEFWWKPPAARVACCGERCKEQTKALSPYLWCSVSEKRPTDK